MKTNGLAGKFICEFNNNNSFTIISNYNLLQSYKKNISRFNIRDKGGIFDTNRI